MSVPFEELETCDLRVGEVYEGGPQPHVGADPIAKLLTVGNQGGFRIAGQKGTRTHRAVLFSTDSQPEWPDHVDEDRAVFTYYGDNRTPGRDLHDPRGNQLLRDSWCAQGEGIAGRDRIPPFFVFQSTGQGRAVRFLGLAAFGVDDDEEDLVAVWRRRPEGAFLNYRARFTLLDQPVLLRSELDSMFTPLDDADEWWLDCESLEHMRDEPLAWATWRYLGLRVPRGAEPLFVAHDVMDVELPILEEERDLMLLERKARGASTATVHSWIWSAGADDPDYFDHGESAAELPDSLREAHYLALRWKELDQDR